MSFVIDFMTGIQSEDVIAGSLLHDFRIEYPIISASLNVFTSEYSNTETADDVIGLRDSSTQSPVQEEILGPPNIPNYRSISPFEYNTFDGMTSLSLSNTNQLYSTEDATIATFGFDQTML